MDDIVLRQLKDSNCRNKSEIRKYWTAQDKTNKRFDVYEVNTEEPIEELLREIKTVDPKYHKRVEDLINKLWTNPCDDSYINTEFKNYDYDNYLIPEATHRDQSYEIDEQQVWSKDIFGRNILLYKYDTINYVITVFSVLGHGEIETEETKSYLSEEVNTKLFSEGTMSAKEQWLKEHPLPKVLQDYKMPIFLKDNEVSPLTNQQKELMRKAFQLQYEKKLVLKEIPFPTKQEFERLGIKGTFI